jgi:hypothetical protein
LTKGFLSRASAYRDSFPLITDGVAALRYCGVVSERKREPSDADGPLFREAYERAGEIDNAPPGQQHRAWGRFLRVAAIALAEGFLRETFVWGAVAFSIIAAVVGATSGEPAWAVTMVAAGIAGTVLVFWSIAKKWSFGRQWAVLLGVLVVQIALIVVLWRTN